jgi:hypothetical protein
MPSKTLVAAIALVADARDFRLCDGLVPCRQRRHEGRNDQMARSNRTSAQLHNVPGDKLLEWDSSSRPSRASAAVIRMRRAC